MCAPPQKKEKRQRIYDLFNAETKTKFLCLTYKKQRKHLTEKVSHK